jgi:hypothetical protein
MAKNQTVDEFDQSRLSQTLPLPRMIEEQVLKGIDAISEINKVLLAEESGTPVRDLDKELKAEAEKVAKGETSDLPVEVLSDWTEAQDAYKVYREKVEAARNSLRKAKGEEETSGEVTPEQKEQAQEIRKTVNDAIKFVIGYAEGNNLTDTVDYFKSLEVPQVGRAGSSTVGSRKPRVFVFVDDADTPHESFTEASKKLSTKEQAVSVSDLVSAWDAVGAEDGATFEFGGHKVRVVAKPKKSDEK